MSHYFQDDENLISKPFLIDFTIGGIHLSLYSDNGVFSKMHLDYGTKYLLEVLLSEKLRGQILDMGCGYGVIGLTLATSNNSNLYTLADINPRCVSLAKKNVDYLKFKNVQVLESDGFTNIVDKYDCIVMNPPIRIGVEKLMNIFVDSTNSLKNQGLLFLVIRKDQGAESWIKRLLTIYEKVQIKAKRKGYFIIQCEKN
jgi:16S rRNA (guanine1207-N2)-methyltransferase